MKIKSIFFIKLFIGILILSVSLFYIYANNYDLEFSTRVSLVFLYALISLFITYEIYKIKKINYLPIFILTNIYFFVCYLLLFFFNKDIIFPRFNEFEFSYAIKILFYGYLAFILGYFINHQIFKNFNRKGFKFLNASVNEFFIIGSFCLLINLFFYEFFDITQYIRGTNQTRYVFIIIGIALLAEYLFVCQKNKNTILKIFLSSILIFFTLSSFIINAAMSYPFMLLFLIFIYFSYRGKKIYIASIFIVFVLFIFMHLGKYDYRELIAQNNQKNVLHKVKNIFDVQARVLSKKEYITKYIDCNENCQFGNNYQLERRIFHSFESLLIVTSLSPNDIPYWNGYSYLILKSKIIPRIFWKDKPNDQLGNEFGQRYNVLTKENKKLGHKKDESTSWNMPVFNELYVNYGIKGTIFGMFIVGTIFAFIAKVFAISNHQNIEKAVAFFIFVPIFFLESHASLIFGALIHTYIFSMILSYILLKLLRKFY